jgi:hypothetical protein
VALRKARTWAIAAAGAAALALGAVPALTASATTLTCTNVAHAGVPPIGCGGDQLAYQAKGTLDLAVLGKGTSTGNYWNSPVGFLADSQSATREDFTVFAVNGDTTDGPGGLGEYVAMYTPNGNIASFTYTGGTGCPASGTTESNTTPDIGCNFNVGTNVYCVSAENVNTARGLRWFAVLRNCNTNGIFHYGTNDGTTFNSVSSGHANHFQVWAPVSNFAGLTLVNESLSHGFKAGNTPYVLDDKGFGGSGTQALAYPENDGLNQQGTIIGCTDPIKALNTGYQFCP